jgi:hypothetical protein
VLRLYGCSGRVSQAEKVLSRQACQFLHALQVLPVRGLYAPGQAMPPQVSHQMREQGVPDATLPLLGVPVVGLGQVVM